jgi:hypothetical protein
VPWALPFLRFAVIIVNSLAACLALTHPVEGPHVHAHAAQLLPLMLQ